MGELEEELAEVRAEHDKEKSDLHDKISSLEADVHQLTTELQSWKFRNDTMDRIVEYERKEKEAAISELSYLRNGLQTTGTDAVPLPPRRSQHLSLAVPSSHAHPSPEPNNAGLSDCSTCQRTGRCACVEAIASSGCGKCTSTSRCECLEETFEGLPEVMAADAELKRPHSPESNVIQKRPRQDSELSSPMEIDFTSSFSKTKLSVEQAPPSLDSNIVAQRQVQDHCGFCEPGSYCVCAEMAANANNTISNFNSRDAGNRLAPLLNEVTPPPSEGDVTVSDNLKLPSLQPNPMQRRAVANTASNPCANGPGTCQQCQSDPRSGLFCRSLAALREAGGDTEGCCGGNGGGGGCCKSKPQESNSGNQQSNLANEGSSSHGPPPSLSCADTYKTLSTHKGFDQASDELNTWLGRLHATPPQHPGRAPMEVEAASVMGVLKLFDRRFGRG